MFPEETVEFKTRNIYDINPKTSVCEIRTVGSAVAISDDENDEQKTIKKMKEGNISAYRPLPEEFYVWNPRSMQFKRTEGRKAVGKGYMTDIYDDYAKSTAGWSFKPGSIKEKSLLDLLYDESQTEDKEQDD